MNDLFIEFLLEAEENLLELQRSLDLLIVDSDQEEALKSALRVLHNLKGGFGMFQMSSAQGTLHDLETMVEEQKNAGFTAEFFIWLQSQLGYFERLIQVGRESQKPTDLPLTLIPYEGVSVDGQKTPVSPTMESSSTVMSGNKIKSPADSHVRVSLGKIDHVLSSVWEIFMTRNQLSYMIDLSRPLFQQNPGLMRSWETLDSTLRRTIGELESQVMEMRMVPVSGVFERMARVVQQFTYQSGKKIRFETFGGSLEVDKRIVDALADPLIHLIRNAMDHGVEAPEERAAKGKNEEGLISLKAEIHGAEVVISVVDDGKGLNRDVLKGKAIEKGFADVQNWDDQQILNVIFEPGFSTAQTLSEISGRGVGMEAVRSQIEDLSGLIEVISEPNKGCEFRVKIPLSVSVLNCLIFGVHGIQYAIPNNEILEAYTIERSEIKTNGNSAYYGFRGQPLKVIDLTDKFPREEKDDLRVIEQETPVLIVNSSSSSDKYALVVSEIKHNQEIVSKPPPLLAHALPYVSGVSILADGKPIFMLSAQKITHHFVKERESKNVSVA